MEYGIGSVSYVLLVLIRAGYRVNIFSVRGLIYPVERAFGAAHKNLVFSADAMNKFCEQCLCYEKKVRERDVLSCGRLGVLASGSDAVRLFEVSLDLVELRLDSQSVVRILGLGAGVRRALSGETFKLLSTLSC